MQHQSLTDELRDRVTLYALDMLKSEERRVVATHLKAGCLLCAEEIQSVERVVGLLGYTVSAVPPRPEVRTRLLARLALETA
jgi:hypothetical protein